MNPQHPELAVLIVNYNAVDYLEACLNSVSAVLKNTSYEVCVIDNASSDQSVRLVRDHFPSVHLIINPQNVGFAAAINQGIRNTTAPWLFWLNPDSEITEGDAAVLLNYGKANPRTGILGIRVENPDGSIQLSCRSFPSYSTAFFNRYSLLTKFFPKNPVSRRYLKSDWEHNEIRAVDWVSGAGLFHKREVIHEIGFLDEAFFMYCEDVDFSYRARKAGWEVVFHPGLTIRHHIGGSSRSVRTRMIIERHRSMRHYYQKHFSRSFFKDILTYAAIHARCFFQIVFSRS